MNQPETASVISSSTEISSAEYFAQRQLKQGTVGWLLLIGLGVAYVISGDFAGWNFGIAQGVYCHCTCCAYVPMPMPFYVRNVHYDAYGGWWL
jgi:hypothetical protein